jgi:c-di-GMP-binding flagellar brake protein YcgR
MLLPDGSVVDGAIQDLSESGIFLVADTNVATETLVVLRFALPSGHIVATQAKVRWRKESATQAKAALGLEFTELDQPARDAIADYVRRAEVA